MLGLKVYRTFLIILSSLLIFVESSRAQEDPAVISNTKSALQTGSSKELVKFFNDIVELSIDGEKSNYSKTQAEFVLKDFFKKYPPVDFQYIHKGSSKEGLIYAIGKYTYNGGSFRVYILVKQFNGNYLIDTLDFSKE